MPRRKNTPVCPAGQATRQVNEQPARQPNPQVTEQVAGQVTGQTAANPPPASNALKAKSKRKTPPRRGHARFVGQKIENDERHAGTKWTPADIQGLLDGRREGITHEQIAARLGRTALACRLHLHQVRARQKRGMTDAEIVNDPEMYRRNGPRAPAHRPSSDSRRHRNRAAATRTTQAGQSGRRAATRRTARITSGQSDNSATQTSSSSIVSSDSTIPMDRRSSTGSTNSSLSMLCEAAMYHERQKYTARESRVETSGLGSGARNHINSFRAVEYAKPAPYTIRSFNIPVYEPIQRQVTTLEAQRSLPTFNATESQQWITSPERREAALALTSLRRHTAPEIGGPRIGSLAALADPEEARRNLSWMFSRMYLREEDGDASYPRRDTC
ncbi:hypothetical protein BDZ85DRAFT_248247 [Elsinoe ampelina]|uniref:Myb-like domain-containing protein n=1 Tax=Elsinoe ampelina TaxID=302913 RepID=A0A6A6GGH4_9PEZI|nr:hypothetical protein BDZ85DRAFT_248247 [Elsinoe ampelina]